MTPYLETTVLKFKDLGEQPPSKYVLLLQGDRVVPQVSIAVDHISITAEALYGFLDGEVQPRVIFPIRGLEFGVFHRNTFDTITREHAIRGTTIQLQTLKDLRKELDPRSVEEEEMAHDLETAQLKKLHESMGMAAVGNGGKGTGQYI